MKIQLVPDPAPSSAPSGPTARIPFAACPLCDGASGTQLKEEDGSHDPLMGPELHPTWEWTGCENCGHIYTTGHLADEAREAVLSRGAPPSLTGEAYQEQRRASATVVHRISSMRGSIDGVWLDVGFGGGELLCTAQEFGYDTVGIDLRSSVVESAEELGFQAACAPIEALDGEQLYDVISFSNVLEQTLFPLKALEAAARLLRPGGVVYIATSNLDSRPWRQLENSTFNAEWSEVERVHIFSREHLCWAMRRVGLEPCDYMASATSPVGMEVCATLASDDES